MRMMDVDKLKPHPKNSYFFDDIEGEPWTAFLESIETSGVIEPVIVDASDMTIVSGHQRVRACKKLGIKQVAVEERGYDSEDERLKQLIETNIRQRGIGNANAVKFGRCVAELERIYGIRQGRPTEEKATNGRNKTQEDLADDLGVDKKTLQRAKKLAELPEEFQQMVMDGKVTASTASRVIARLSPEEQQKLAESISGKDKVSGKEVDAEIARLKDENKRLRDDNKILARRSDPTVIEKTVEVEVIPDDYDDLKKRINELESSSNDVRAIQSAQDSMDAFATATQDYIRRYSGNAWSFDKWADIPEATRKNFEKAVKDLSAFAQQMVNTQESRNEL